MATLNGKTGTWVQSRYGGSCFRPAYGKDADYIREQDRREEEANKRNIAERDRRMREISDEFGNI
jgi:hypothetical protein